MDEAALLAAIAAHPAEDTPRLAYADWLDEHAADLPDPAAARVRAEFIRVQCEIHVLRDRTSTELQGYADLYRRQNMLLTRHLRDLVGPLGETLTDRDLIFDRGFLTEVKLTSGEFVRHADAIAELKPLPDVSVFEATPDPRFLGCPHLGLITSVQWAGTTGGVAGLNPFARPRDRTWTRLRAQYLDGCDLGDVDIPAVTATETYPALVHLTLSGNGITDEGVRELIASPLWPRLKSLVLGANPITDEGAFALADAPPTALEYLNVSRTHIGQAGQQRLLRRKGWKVDLF